MRENPSPSLSEVAAELNAWRNQGRQGAIPDHIREQAVALLATHKVSHVIDALGINHRMMRQWREQCHDCSLTEKTPVLSTPSPAFVTLAPINKLSDEPLLPHLKLVHQHEGLSLTLEGRLSLSQWQQTLALLQQLELNG